MSLRPTILRHAIHPRHFPWPCAVIAALLMVGCAAPPASEAAREGSADRRSARANDASDVALNPEHSDRPPVLHVPARTVIDARPAALMDGYGVAFGDLLTALTEAGGAEVLRETLLDRALEPRIRTAGITIDEPALARERRTLLESLHDDVNTATRLLDELRRRRGLGPVRFERLIRRTAMLRALVRDEVRLTERAILDAFDTQYGARRTVRLLLTDDLDGAHAARRALDDGAFFPELAAQRSRDESASRGGMLDPVTRRDPSWPQAIRDAVWRLEAPGEVSPPVRLDDGFALLQFVEEIPAAPITLDSVREQVEHAVRLNQERLLMDDLARRLLGESRVTILDRTLEEAWRRGPRD